MQFSPDGTILASGGTLLEGGKAVGGVKLWSLATKTEQATLRHGSQVDAIAFSPDGQTLASGGWEEDGEIVGTIKLWNVRFGKEESTLKGHATSVKLAFSPIGKTLASADIKGIVRVWDVATRTELFSFQGNEKVVTALAFSPDGQTLAVAGGERRKPSAVKLWDMMTGKEKRTLKETDDQVSAVAYAPNGRVMASSGGEFSMELYLWETGTGKARTAKGGIGAITSLVFAPNSRLLALTDSNGGVALVDVSTGQQTAYLVGTLRQARSVAFSPDGMTLAAAAGDIVIWEADKPLAAKP